MAPTARASRSSTPRPARSSPASRMPAAPIWTRRCMPPTRAFKVWRKVSGFDRYKLMRKAAELIRSRADEIAPLMTQEQGKPLAEAKAETLLAGDLIDWFAEEARRTYGRLVPPRAEGVVQAVIKEPVGPVAAFTPWNFPINQAVRKVSAALAAGCSVILKGPEETPASCAALIKCYVDAGVPAGVVNLVFGVPSEISEYLIPHPVIRKITFTGLDAGRQEARRARRPAHEAHHDGARWPRAGDRVRRCRRRRRREDVRRREVPQRRPGVRLADALPRARVGLFALRRGLRQDRQFDQGRRRHEPGYAHGPAGEQPPHRGDADVHRGRGRQGRQDPSRRQAHRHRGLLLRADRDHRRACLGAHPERGAVRPDRAHRPVQQLRRSGRRGEPAAVRLGRLCLHALAENPPPRSATRSKAAWSRSTTWAWRCPRSRSAA